MSFNIPKNYNTARLLANINDRAARLFENGYTLKRIDATDVIITNEEGDKYEVSTFWESCDCPCFKNHGTCKHYLGWKQLEETQAEYEEHLLEGYNEPDDYAKAVYEESLLRRTCGANI